MAHHIQAIDVFLMNTFWDTQFVCDRVHIQLHTTMYTLKITEWI